MNNEEMIELAMSDGFDIEVVEEIEALDGWDNAKSFTEGFFAGCAVVGLAAT